MKLLFDKMHGAGNDFIIADDSGGIWPRQPDFIRSVCNRHTGIGGDGLILIQNVSGKSDLKMTYFNSDGSRAAMCGNGLRCAASFIYRHGLAAKRRSVRLFGDDGPHDTQIIHPDGSQVKVSLAVSEEFHPVVLESGETVYKGSVGVPHVIVLRSDPESVDVRKEGAFLRNHSVFQPDGANVDFVSPVPDPESGCVVIRTYERGVEDETLACGTGCASAGVVLHQFFGFGEKICLVCRGKDHIEVEILKDCSKLTGVFLTGPAKTAFRGEISV